MSHTSQDLRLTVNIEEEDGTRTKEYTDHTKYLRDLREWRRYADKRNLRLEEETTTTLNIGAEEGPLFS